MSDDLTQTERTLLDMNARGCTQEQCAAAFKRGDRWVRRMFAMLAERGYTIKSRQTIKSGRPQQVADMLNTGMTCREIAAELGLAFGTVRDYRDKAKNLGLSVPMPAIRDGDTPTIERLRREIQAIRAPALDFKGRVFEDVRLKHK